MFRARQAPARYKLLALLIGIAMALAMVSPYAGNCAAPGETGHRCTAPDPTP